MREVQDHPWQFLLNQLLAAFRGIHNYPASQRRGGGWSRNWGLFRLGMLYLR
jgi:hypothetical protein